MFDTSPAGWTPSRARRALQLVMLIAVASLAAASVMIIVCYAVFRALATVH